MNPMDNSLDILLQQPVEEFLLPTGMHAEVLHKILLRFALPISMPAGMNDQDVAVLRLDRHRLDHGGRDDGQEQDDQPRADPGAIAQQNRKATD